MTIYTYPFTAFSGGSVHAGALRRQIENSAITIAMNGVSTDEGAQTVDVDFKAALPSTDKLLLDGDGTQTPNATPGAGTLIYDHDGTPLNPKPPKKTDGAPIVALHADLTDWGGQLEVHSRVPVSGGLRVISHNFCDKCTWWHESSEQVDKATTTSDQFTYDITGVAGVIDLRHGRFTFEDVVTTATVAPNGNTMTNLVPTVKVNAVALDQSNEDATSGNDRYTIDYASGSVTFAVARAGGDTVTVSCRQAGSSKWTFKPSSGKKWIVEDAELDMSEDIDQTSDVVSTTYGSHTTVTGGAVVPVQTKRYKTFHDFQAAARRFWGPVPSGFGGSVGIASPKWTFEWQYARSDELYSTANWYDLNGHPTRVTPNSECVHTEGNVEFGGSFMTVTLYGQEVDE